MNYLLKIYEYPLIINQNDFVSKITTKKTMLTYPLHYVDTIQNSSSIRSDAICKNNYNNNINISTNIEYFESHSCDPLLFIYNTFDSVPILNDNKRGISDTLNNYKFDKTKYSNLYNNLKHIGYINDIMLYDIAKYLELPEMNTIGCFKEDKCVDNISINTNNYNLKMHNLDSIKFKNILDYLRNKYKELHNIKGFPNINIMQNMNMNSLTSRVVYITKLNLNNNSQVCIFGDIHGGIHTLVRSILRLVKLGFINNDFTLLKNNHIIFLGDLVDRGLYGIEVFYFVITLLILNPNNVHIIRGNHEECCTSTKYGLDSEFKKLDLEGKEIYKYYCETLLYLPVAIFLNKEIQLCHGGLYRDATIIKQFLESKDQYLVLEHVTDIQWSDFVSNSIENKEINYTLFGERTANRGSIYSGKDVLNYCNYVGLTSIIRGHEDAEHNTKLLPYIIDNTDITTRSLAIQHFNLPKVINDSCSFMLKLPNKNINLLSYAIENKFYPVITLTTGLPARFVINDSFAILEINKNNSKYKIVINKN